MKFAIQTEDFCLDSRNSGMTSVFAARAIYRPSHYKKKSFLLPQYVCLFETAGRAIFLFKKQT